MLLPPPLLIAGCDPDWGGDSVTAQLDNKAVEGCYVAAGLPDLRVEAGQVKSGDRVVYNRYKYVRSGRDSLPVIVVEPRSPLVKSPSGKYNFQPAAEDSGTFSYEVLKEENRVTISIVSSPDAVRHEYERTPCGDPMR